MTRADSSPPSRLRRLERARSLANDALASRERTVAELRGLLERRQVAPETADSVVAELLEVGVLDDSRYARCFTDDRRRLDRWGAERIARDLARRGVDHDLIEASLADRSSEQELTAALELLADRFQSPASDRERDRAWRALVRRGYAPELAYDAVRAHERNASHPR